MSSLPKSQWSWKMSQDLFQNEAQFLVIDYKKRVVLLHREEEHWVLPGFLGEFDSTEFTLALRCEHPELRGTRHLWPIQIAWQVSRYYEIKTEEIWEGKDLVKYVVVLEWSGEDLPPIANYEWRPLDGAKVYHLFPDACARIQSEIEIAVTGVQPEKRMAWQHPGWFAKAISLVEEKVGESVEDVFILRSSERGAVFRAKTTAGSFYLKCSPPSANDASFSELMAKIAPKYCSQPVFVDKENQLMITNDYGEPTFFYNDSVLAYKAISAYAEIQKSSIGRTSKLLEAGMIDARPERMNEIVSKIESHPELDVLARLEESDGEIHRDVAKDVRVLRHNLEKLRVLLQRDLDVVIELGIPATVLHNDLWSYNVCVDEESGEVRVFDWEIGFVGHPLMEPTDYMPEGGTEHFVSKWTAYGTEKHLLGCVEKLRCYGFLCALLRMLNVAADVETWLKAHVLTLATEYVQILVSYVMKQGRE